MNSVKNESEEQEKQEKARVVIADCDDNFTMALSAAINRQPGLEFGSVVKSGEMVNQAIENTGAKILIMDLLLPVLDGFAVLSRLNKLNKKPDLIVVASVLGSETLVRRATELGADYFVIKPVSPDVLTEKIVDLGKIFVKNGSSEEGNGNSGCSSVLDLPILNFSNVEKVKEPALVMEKPVFNIRKETTKLLHEMGIPANLKGHNYIRDAVIMVLEDRKLVSSITKTIYPNLGKRYQTSACSVERAIRTALETAWIRGRTASMNDIFGFTININKGKPTNAEFIAMIADKLSLDCS